MTGFGIDECDLTAVGSSVGVDDKRKGEEINGIRWLFGVCRGVYEIFITRTVSHFRFIVLSLPRWCCLNGILPMILTGFKS